MPLVKLINDDGRDTFKRRIGEQAPDKHTFRQKPNASARAANILEAKMISNGLTDPLAKLIRDTVSRHFRRKPARLEHENFAIFPESRR